MKWLQQIKPLIKLKSNYLHSRGELQMAIKRNIKVLSLGAAALAAALVLTGCGNNDSAASADEAAVDGTPTIVLYSNAISDGRGEWIAERAMEDLGINVQLVDDGGVVIANRILAEQNNPMADVVFGLNQILWSQLIEADAIIPYTPVWADEIPEGLSHPDGWFNAVSLVGNLLAYDTAQIDNPPTDWLELSSFEGQYAVPNALGGSTVQMILSGIFTRFLDEDGHLGVSDEGWEAVRDLFANGVSTDQDLVAEWVNPANNVGMSQIWHMGLPPREAEFGITAGVVNPEIGIPVSVEGVAIVNGTQNQEAVERFINWFGSAEIMNAFGYAFNYLPANPNALEGLQDFTIQVSEMKIQDINWDVIAPNMGSWIEHIYLNYLQ